MFIVFLKKKAMQQMPIPEEAKVEIDFDQPNIPLAVKILEPVVFKEGDAYCCLLGPDPQEGIFGCGKSSDEAVQDWNKHFQEMVDGNNTQNETLQYAVDKMGSSIHKIN
jgi:hypothetical protein